MPPEYQQVLTTLGKQGDYKANVLKGNNTIRVKLSSWPKTIDISVLEDEVYCAHGTDQLISLS